MKARTFQSRFWKDNFIRTLNSVDKLVYIYLLTNDKVNIIFCYEISDDEIKFDLGITQQQLKHAQTQLINSGRVDFHKGWIHLLKAHKYEKYTGSLNETAKQTLIGQMSSEIRAWFDTPIDRGIYTPLKGSIDHKSYIINNTKGVVKGDLLGKKFSHIGDVGEEEFQRIVDKYQVPISFVKSKYDDMINWHEENPIKNNKKNWFATLRNWVKTDAIKIKSAKGGILDARNIT